MGLKLHRSRYAFLPSPFAADRYPCIAYPLKAADIGRSVQHEGYARPQAAMHDLRIPGITRWHAVLQFRRNTLHILQLQHQNGASGIRPRYHFRRQPAQNFQHLLPVGQYSIHKVDSLKLVWIHRHRLFFLRFHYFRFCIQFFRYNFLLRLLFRFLSRFFYVRIVFIFHFPSGFVSKFSVSCFLAYCFFVFHFFVL